MLWRAGDYEAPAVHSVPAFTIAGRHFLPDVSEENLVGPAEYYVPAAFPAGPAYTMPHAALADPATDDADFPGTHYMHAN